MANQQAKHDDNRVPGLLIQDSTGAETRQIRSSTTNPNALPVEVVASGGSSITRTLFGKQTTTITSSTSETTIVTAGAAGVYNDIYKLIIANTSATATEVVIRDATGGTGNSLEPFYVPAGDTRGFTLIGTYPSFQTTAANNWTAQCTTSVASIKVTAYFVKNT